MSHDPSGLKLAAAIRQEETVIDPAETPSTPVMLELIVRGGQEAAVDLLRALEKEALTDDRVVALWSGVSGEVDRGRLFPDRPAYSDEDLRRLEHPQEFPVPRRSRWWFR